jgi:CP family cyanate transporter-like MFS transporter
MMTESSSATEPAAHPYRWAMLAGTWLIYFSFGLTASALATLVVPIETELGLSHAAMGSIFGAWTLVFIFSAMPCGALMDRIGPRRSLLLAALFIAVSGFLRGTAEGFASLFFAVGVFGVGGPLVAIGSPKLISLWFAGKDRAVAMGLYITGPSLGSVLGLSLTNSFIMPLFDSEWRHVLFAYAAFALFCGLVWLVISAHPASREMERRVAAEPRVSQLKVFAELIHVRAVQIMLLMAVGIFFFNHSLNNWLPELLRHSGMDESTAGFWAAIPTAIGIVGALIIPRFATPERRLRVLVFLFVCAAGSTFLLHSNPGLALSLALILQGLAKSSMMTLSLLTVMEIPEVGSRHTGSASGMFFSAAEVGGVLGPLTLGITYDATGNFDQGLLILTVDCLVLMLLALILSRLNRSAP